MIRRGAANYPDLACGATLKHLRSCCAKELAERQAVRAFCGFLAICVLAFVAAAAAQARDLGDMSGAEIKALQQRLSDGGCYHGATDGKANATLQAAMQACPDQEPMLGIETGMHVAAIIRIGVDHACRFAATGSWDKTVRVWSMPDGRLLRILRVPIGPGDGGKIYAVAVSPDGHWIAAGGHDASSADFVYVFDAATGSLVSRVGPFDNVVNHLAFSPDGRWLAVMSSDRAGAYVIDVQNWRIVMHDRLYAGVSFGGAFGPNGNLYTAAYDGKLRQYGPGPAFKKIREVATRGGKRPHSVAVDPRGELVAVGFFDTNKIDIYDAATLRLRRSLDAKGTDRDNLMAVGWSSDGARLVAGGMYQLKLKDGWTSVLLTFGRDGERIGDPVPLGTNSISSLQPCGDAIAVAAADPGFGLVGDNGQVRLWTTGVTADLRNEQGPAFTIAANANQVRFSLGGRDVDPVLFDISQMTLTNAPNPIPGFAAALTDGLPVAGWQDSVNPTFNKRPLGFDGIETSRSLAIRPDKTGFVLGTEWFLRAYDATGQQRWQQAQEGVAWNVNFSADGRVIVATYGDGTVRWHRWSDGKELLALFVNRKTKAWVAWTHSGYYMASPGGEDLIGWHVNRGWDQAADFFPASRFRQRFNRPDIVRLVLDTLDEDAAIKQANDIAKHQENTQPLIERLPPIIRIVDPTDGTHVPNGTVTLDYAVRSPSGQPVERINILVDGRPVKTISLPVHPTAANTETKGTLELALSQRNVEVGLIAWSGDLASEAARVRLTWDGAPQVTRRLYALVVGVGDYADPEMRLTYPAKDARDFAKALGEQKGRYYADVETRVVTDRDVTRASIIEGLEWLEKMAADPNDVSVLFLAGHGLTDAKQTYWFYTSDANDDDVRVKGVSQDEIRNALQNLQGKVLWFLDTCHAGAAAKRPPVDINVLVNTVSASENGGIVVFASSTGRQVSVESSALGNGAFTKALVEGIELGKADLLGNGFVTTSSLDTFVENRVQQLTDGKQNPVMERPPEEPDFAIAEVRK
jgi:WD40 repeat protein